MSDDAAVVTLPPYCHGSIAPPVRFEPSLAYLLLMRELEDVLYHEADLLDQWRYRDWLDLVTDDIRYWAPIRRNVRFGEWAREQTRELSDLGWFDDNRTVLEKRIAQLETGTHWAEEPLSRVSHVISGVRVTDIRPDLDDPQEVTVRSRFVVYRNHQDDDEMLLIGKREDDWRRVGADWKLARRTIIFDHSVLLAQNITILL